MSRLVVLAAVVGLVLLLRRRSDRYTLVDGWRDLERVDSV